MVFSNVIVVVSVAIFGTTVPCCAVGYHKVTLMTEVLVMSELLTAARTWYRLVRVSPLPPLIGRVKV